jgi:hypothetical protein
METTPSGSLFFDGIVCYSLAFHLPPSTLHSFQHLFELNYLDFMNEMLDFSKNWNFNRDREINHLYQYYSKHYSTKSAPVIPA